MSERTRTLQHMQHLMALAALTSCKRTPDTVDAGVGVTVPGTSAASGAPSVVDASPPVVDAGAPVDAGATSDAGKKDAGPKTVSVPTISITHTAMPPPTSGYGVVDMLPPPAPYKK